MMQAQEGIAEIDRIAAGNPIEVEPAGEPGGIEDLHAADQRTVLTPPRRSPPARQPTPPRPRGPTAAKREKPGRRAGLPVDTTKVRP